MPRVTSISVVMPAYNEQDNLVASLGKIYKYLNKNFKNFELIVVNDGSFDRTKSILEKNKKKLPKLKPIHHENNKGYGSALRSGFEKARYKWIFYTDADCQFDIKDLEKVLPLSTKYDIVAGYRENRQDPLMRIFIAWVYNLLIRMVFGLEVRDVDCAFKLYRSDIFNSFELTSKSGLIDVEILHKAKQQGYSVAQVGVKHYPRTRGQTSYELGSRNKIFAFVKPKTIADLLLEIWALKQRTCN